ncbi:glutathione synthase [Aliiglaciecola sp. CAU 1673]|uniref:glutathione synthase n=1 Tax=Aliiglaciecola sp. CAU 1673 TaxID=3032595 RepID=UPI0023DC8580|nr:glutathione synthase [Aliiglaciecola sp. CAU 1673]MDF2179944.1 glutathione synthase [Aliiglaciecola sp. CAU 1673]
MQVEQMIPRDLGALSTQQKQLGLGMLADNGTFSPLSVSLTPWKLNAGHWQRAQWHAKVLNKVLCAMAADRDWLLNQFSELSKGSSLPGKLARLLSATDPDAIKAIGMPLIRHDMMLDKDGQWRWVESNSIAAGMGPLNQQWVSLLKQQLPLMALLPNPAINQQAEALYKAAKQFQQVRPVVLFVVEEQEDNLFDQLLLADGIRALGAIVGRISLKSLILLISNQGDRLLWQDREVDLLYFRTGYNDADYSDPDLLSLRARLERLNLVLCPNIALQLAGSKWIQQVVYQQLFNAHHQAALAQQLGLDLNEQKQLLSLQVPALSVSAIGIEQAQTLIKDGWWLKTQQEGGGSVAIGDKALQKLHTESFQNEGWIVMAPIPPSQRQDLEVSINGHCRHWPQAVSELGIFMVGEQHQFGGYLLRSKPVGQIEGGVHRGGAVLDSLLVT